MVTQQLIKRGRRGFFRPAAVLAAGPVAVEIGHGDQLAAASNGIWCLMKALNQAGLVLLPFTAKEQKQILGRLVAFGQAVMQYLQPVPADGALNLFQGAAFL